MDLLNQFCTKGLTASVCKSDKMHLKTVVNCGIPGEITLETKLKIPIFTL